MLTSTLSETSTYKKIKNQEITGVTQLQVLIDYLSIRFMIRGH